MIWSKACEDGHDKCREEAGKWNATKMAMVRHPGSSQGNSRGRREAEKYPAALAMVTVLFFFWGFVTV